MTLLFERLFQLCIDKGLTFCAYSKPGKDFFKIIIENPHSDSTGTHGFVFHPFVETKEYPRVFISADFHLDYESITTDVISQLENFHHLDSTIDETIISEISFSEYHAQLTKGISEIQNSDLKKFIFSRVETHPKSKGFNAVSFLKSLKSIHSQAFVYYLHHPSCGNWMGATPETLANWKNGKFQTMSLAGTQPNSQPPFDWKPKEIQEQTYVTAYIENIFSENNISYIKSETETVEAGPVVHLQTRIETENNISYSQALKLLDSLHPTPAVCGVPLQKALETINQLESHDRAYYTGYLGLISPERELDLFVNLRCMRILPKSIALYLGGGITEDSEVEKEWEETHHKAKTLLSAM